MRLKTLVIITLFSAPLLSMAEVNFTNKPGCGSAKIVSGETCSNANIEMTFQNCELKSGPQVIKKVTCVGDRMRATFEEGNFKYEAEFRQHKEGWNAVTWKSAGKLKQFEKSSAEREIAANSTPSGPASLKFSSFFDIRFSSFTAKENPSVTADHAESGFGLEDGAFFINYEKEKLAFVADISLRRAKDSERDITSTTPNQSQNNSLAFGVDRSQLYLRHKANNSLTINFGQFDTIYGVELNDSKDRVFGKTGLVYDTLLPVTHTGIMFEAPIGPTTAKLFAANPNNKGSFGTSATQEESTEYGAAVGYSNETMRAQIGYMSRSMLKADGLKRDTRDLVDFTAGLTHGKFTLDIEVALLKDPSKNTLTTADATDQEDSGMGTFILMTYKFNDNFLVGARAEQLKDDPTASSYELVTSSGLSLHYKLSSDLEMRAEHNSYSYETLANVTWNDTRSNIAAIVTF